MTVNRGLDGPLFLCPDANAMKPHNTTTINKILNALTFGMLNRISILENNYNWVGIESSVASVKLNRVDEDVSELTKEVDRLRDELATLRHSNKSLIIAEVVKAMDLPTIINIIKEQTASEIEHNLDRKIRLHGIVLQRDLPDFDEFVKYEAHGDEVLTVDSMKDTFGEEMRKEYFEDHVRDIVRNLCNDEYATDDRVREIMQEDCEYTTEDRVRDMIENEISEKNLIDRSDAEGIADDAIEAHTLAHHPDDEDETQDAAPDEEQDVCTGKLLNDLMKPVEPVDTVVLSGKMVSCPISMHGLTSMALTNEERNIIMVIRANSEKVNDADADTMQEVISEIGDEDERRAIIDTMLKATAEYAFGMGLWEEEMAHSLRKEGRQSEALLSSVIAHGYEETGQAINAVPSILERAEQHAHFVSERVEDK